MSTTTYRAAVVRTAGGPDSIEIIEVPVSEPGPGQVRVEIAGAAVNPVDLALAAGVFHGLGLVDQPDHTAWAGTSPAPSPRRVEASTSRSAAASRDWSTGSTATSARTPSSSSSQRLSVRTLFGP